MILINYYFRATLPVLMLLFFSLLMLSLQAQAQLQPLDSEQMADISAQSGVSIEGTLNLHIDDIAYQQRPDSSYQVLHDINAQWQYSATTLDITDQGHLRLGLPQHIAINDLSFSVFNSKTAQIDVNNPADIQTYRIYAATLGNAYDGFTLDIEGISLDDGSNQWQGDYVDTQVLTDNASNTFTVRNASDITINLESEDDGFFNEDYARIVVVDEDGNIVGEAGQSGDNDASLSLSFDSPIHHNFILRAELNGNFNLGGAVEVFTGGNVSYKR